MRELEKLPAWDALESIRHSAVVAEARAYGEAVAVRRSRRRALCNTLIPRGRLPRFAMGGLATAGAIAAALLLAQPRDMMSTQVGEIERTTLPDGSTVTLNTDTRVKLAFSEGERRVLLLAGQAHFDVAHDKARPFRVVAGELTVTAVGTAFDVARLPGRTAVTLIEGKVQVEAAPQRTRPVRATLTPGEQLAMTEAGAVTPKRQVPLRPLLAWQEAKVDINALTLAEALAEVNRYSKVKLRVRDSALLGRRVNGVFQAGDVEGVARAMAHYFDLQIVARSDTEIVLGRPA